MEKSHVQVHGGVTTEKVAGTFLIQLFLRLLFWKRKKSTRRLCLQLRKRLEANKTNLIPSHKRTKIPILCGKSTRRSLSTNNKRHVKQRFSSFNTQMVGKRISLNWGWVWIAANLIFFLSPFISDFLPRHRLAVAACEKFWWAIGTLSKYRSRRWSRTNRPPSRNRGKPRIRKRRRRRQEVFEDRLEHSRCDNTAKGIRWRSARPPDFADSKI